MEAAPSCRPSLASASCAEGAKGLACLRIESRRRKQSARTPLAMSEAKRRGGAWRVARGSRDLTTEQPQPEEGKASALLLRASSHRPARRWSTGERSRRHAPLALVSLPHAITLPHFRNLRQCASCEVATWQAACGARNLFFPRAPPLPADTRAIARGGRRAYKSTPPYFVSFGLGGIGVSQ